MMNTVPNNNGNQHILKTIKSIPPTAATSISSSSSSNYDDNNSSKKPSRIVFGSCNDQDRKNNMWPVIESRKPVAFIWGGDAIYADEEYPPDFTTFPPTPPRKVCATPAKVKQLYRKQLSDPSYQRLVNGTSTMSPLTIFGTLDDHDYGCDNSDKTFQYKYETTNAFLDFIGEPKDSPYAQRAAAGMGVYGVKLFDFERPEGQELVPDDEACLDPDVVSTSPACSIHGSSAYSNKTVAIFVLDVRSNKDPWMQGGTAFYSKDYSGDFLGESQWNWFEQAISNSRAAVNVIVNGLQVHSSLFPNPNIAENWGSFPSAQQRLFDTVLGSNAASPILISGDVHMTQMMRKDCRRKQQSSSSINDHPRSVYAADETRPLIEMTTSGMTHSWGGLPTLPADDPNYRFTWSERFEAFIRSTTMHMMHATRPWNSLLVSPSSPSNSEDGHHHGIAEAFGDSGGMEGSRTGLQYSLERNFGELEFDWEDRSVIMRSMGETLGGTPLLSSRIKMDQLSGKQPMSSMHVTDEDFFAVSMELDKNYAHGEWVCVEHRGRASMIREIVGHTSAVMGLFLVLSMPLFLLTLVALYLWRRKSRAPCKGDGFNYTMYPSSPP